LLNCAKREQTVRVRLMALLDAAQVKPSDTIT
jgi:hypothetical protein